MLAVSLRYGPYADSRSLLDEAFFEAVDGEEGHGGGEDQDVGDVPGEDALDGSAADAAEDADRVGQGDQFSDRAQQFREVADREDDAGEEEHRRDQAGHEEIEMVDRLDE